MLLGALDSPAFAHSPTAPLVLSVNDDFAPPVGDDHEQAAPGTFGLGAGGTQSQWRGCP